MQVSEFDTDALLKLLCEALRRGPGSPEWHDALLRIDQTGTADRDEYALLLRARERIESGKSYRQVRAGPAFTRSVFDRLDQPAGETRSVVRPLVVIGLICLLGILVGGGLLLNLLLESRPAEADRLLAHQLFVTPKQQWNFSQPLPDDLVPTGTIGLSIRDGALRPANDTTVPADGMLRLSDAVDLEAGVCVEAEIRYQPGATSLEFVLLPSAATDVAASSGSTTSTSNELYIRCDASGVRCSAATDLGTARPLSPGPHTLRIKCLGDRGSAEVDGRVIWSGVRTIPAQAKIALRWSRPIAGQNDAAVRSLRVLLP